MQNEILEIFEKAGALLEGHFQLTSGLHSPYYWEKFKIIQSPVLTETLCKIIAEHFRKDNIQVVAGPTTGGIILAYETARQLGVRSIFAEKDGDKRIFRRGFEIFPGERVLVVDDILTTGGSIIEVVNAVKQLKGNIIGIGVLVDRSTHTPKFDSLYSAVSYHLLSFINPKNVHYVLGDYRSPNGAVRADSYSITRALIT